VRNQAKESRSLIGYASFAGLVAAIGIPLYIHLPAFLAQKYGIALDTLGALLLALRLIDFAQDPALGWLLARYARHRAAIATTTLVVLGASVLGLFGIAAPISPIIWVTLFLILTFTTFSLLSIVIYSEGVERGASEGHIRVAIWREAATLLGITAACILPFVLPGDGYLGFALIFAVCALVVSVVAPRELNPVQSPSGTVRGFLRDQTTRRFLLLAFLNAAPVAITSTLFIFFVEYRLELGSLSGVFLLLFFFAAAVSTPAWKIAASRVDPIKVLATGMAISIAGFVWASLLGSGSGIQFAIVCIVSGAGLGADLLLLPALFSEQQARQKRDASLAFGFWNFAGKATLAISAGIVLPLLEWSGFQVGTYLEPRALAMLGFLYAVVPSVLKAFAIVVLLHVLAPNLRKGIA